MQSSSCISWSRFAFSRVAICWFVFAPYPNIPLRLHRRWWRCHDTATLSPKHRSRWPFWIGDWIGCIPEWWTKHDIAYCLVGYTQQRSSYFDCFAPSTKLISGEAIGLPKLVLTRVDCQKRFSFHRTWEWWFVFPRKHGWFECCFVVCSSFY